MATLYLSLIEMYTNVHHNMINDIDRIWPDFYRGLLWYLTTLSTIFQLYRDGQFYRKRKLTNFITYCCIYYTSSLAGLELTTLVVIGTDCTGCCKSNYNTITNTMTRQLYWLLHWLEQSQYKKQKGSSTYIYFFFQ